MSKIVDSNGRVLGIGHDRMEAECQVALNCPLLAQSANIIKAALYWSTAKRKGKRDGHFVRKSCDVRSYLVSKSVDKLCDQKPNLPFMM